ncbi:MAG: T9SS type A sorting domain-containing protein, partial [Bacteroidia bacterium]
VNGFRETASTFGAPWNNGYVHADNHVIEWNTRTNPATCIVGCDGGLFSSQNMKTWTSINRGFTSLQLYNVAANELGHVVGGSQDNGTYLLNFSGNSFGGKPSQTGISIFGGDGFDVEFSKYHPATVFMSTYYGTVARSSNSGQSSSTFFDDRQDGKIQTDFNTTYCLWEKDAKESRLFLAKDAEVWVAVNPTDFSNNVSWFMVAGGLGNNRIIEMDYTPDGDHLFICKQGRIFRLDGLNSASYTIADNPGAKDIPVGITLNNITPSFLTGRTVTSVNVDPNNPEHLIVTLGGYGNTTFVYESNDALSANPTFTNISGDLPSMPVYDAVVDVDDPNRIVLATDFGVFVTENGGTNWVEANEGMARVPVFEIRAYEWRPWEGMVMYLGTHGRGYFKSTALLTSAKGPQASDVKSNLFPNPAQDRTSLSFNSAASGQAKVQVLNIQGQVVRQFNHNMVKGTNTLSLDISGLTRGTYFVRFSGAGQSGVSKLMVP